jgi:hypothetical protein
MFRHSLFRVSRARHEAAFQPGLLVLEKNQD